MVYQDIFALDVGYGDTKSAWRGPQGVIQSSFCSVAIPVLRDGTRLDSALLGRRDEKTSRVSVGETVYEVGREADLMAGTESFILHQGYTGTAEYLAFVRAALLNCGVQDVGTLVTGLPVSQYAELRVQLSKRLMGRHILDTKGTSVEIHDVLVVPQPLGGLRDYQHERGASVPLGKQNILIADMGSVTFDWMLSRRMRAVPSRSGSCHVGMAMVFHAIRQSLLGVHKAAPAERDIAEAVIAGEDFVYAAGRKVPLGTHLDEAARRVAAAAIRELRNSLGGTEDIDRVILVGGGGALMRSYIAEVFGGANTPVECLPYPAFANVRGYLRIGVDRLLASNKAKGRHYG